MKQLVILLTALFYHYTVPVYAASGHSEQLGIQGLSLELVALITLVCAVLLLAILYFGFKIKEVKLLGLMLLTAIIFLTVDYLYQKFIKYG